MPKSIYAHAVDDFQAALRLFLHDQRFRIVGRTFNRLTEDGLTQVINIQMGPCHPEYVRNLAQQLGLGSLGE